MWQWKISIGLLFLFLAVSAMSQPCKIVDNILIKYIFSSSSGQYSKCFDTLAEKMYI